MVSALPFHPSAPGLIHNVPKFFQRNSSLGFFLSEFLHVAMLIDSTALLIEWTVQIKKAE